MAIRMAKGLGVHRDGSHFALRPIEIETRRRLWAHLCILDVRIAEQLCREPTITPDSYDTALPLSISDQDLADIDQQSNTSGNDGERNFKSLQEVEQAQEHHTPFSPLTLLLIESEIAKLQQQLLCFHYRSGDIHFRQDPPGASNRLASLISSADRALAQWPDRLESRFESKYNISDLEISDPIQYLASELCHINVAKAKFVAKLTQWKDISGSTPDPTKGSEIVRYVCFTLAFEPSGLLPQRCCLAVACLGARI